MKLNTLPIPITQAESPKVKAATKRETIFSSSKYATLGSSKDIALLNAAALIYISGIASTIADGIKLCENALESKKVYNKIKNLITYTNTFNNA